MVRIFSGILLFFIVVLSPGNSYSQYKKKTQKLAEQLYQSGDYYNAAIYYRKILEFDSSKAEPNFNYAQALRMSNYNKRALHYYRVTYKKDRGKEFPEAIFWIAELYKFQYDYTKAKRYFKRAERYYRGRKSTYYYAKVKKEQKACDEAIAMYRKPVDANITNGGEHVNTIHSEFSGFLLNDSMLYFSSLRPEKDSSVEDVTYNIRLYEAKLKEANGWSTTSNKLEDINAMNYHVANGVFDGRKTKFYYTICTDSNICEIYFSVHDKGTWSEPKALPRKINLPGYTNTQPSLGKMGGEEVLFFVSDRPNGYGQLDVWYCIAYSNGVYSEPKNAGHVINTLGNDISPFYHAPSRSLFFSSDWHSGLGGFDIFKAKYEADSFTVVKNMGYPINTSVNDFYFRVHQNQAILTSNRPGSYTNKSETCCNDLYLMHYDFEVEKEEDPKQQAYDALVEYLPLRLFFHNDEPNPRSQSTATTKNYLSTYEKYLLLLERYKREYSRGLRGDDKLDAQDEITDFFDLEVKEGASNLQKFTALMLDELVSGRKIILTVKGFASPLSKSDYNSNLTLRRISSIENFFNEFRDGVLLPYLKNGQLKVKQQPFGEDKSAADVSDNVNDKRNSIYSKRAAFERRVEIISLTLN